MRVRRHTVWLVGTLLVVSIVASTALASPGGRDAQGGHHCQDAGGFGTRDWAWNITGTGGVNPPHP